MFWHLSRSDVTLAVASASYNGAHSIFTHRCEIMEDVEPEGLQKNKKVLVNIFSPRLSSRNRTKFRDGDCSQFCYSTKCSLAPVAIDMNFSIKRLSAIYLLGRYESLVCKLSMLHNTPALVRHVTTVYFHILAACSNDHFNHDVPNSMFSFAILAGMICMLRTKKGVYSVLFMYTIPSLKALTTRHGIQQTRPAGNSGRTTVALSWVHTQHVLFMWPILC